MNSLRRIGLSNIKQLKEQKWFSPEIQRIANKNNLGKIQGYYIPWDEGDNAPLILVGEVGVAHCIFTENNNGQIKLIDTFIYNLELY